MTSFDASSDAAVALRARALFRMGGRAYADRQETGKLKPFIMAALVAGDPGGGVSDQQLTTTLRDHPILLTEDTGNDSKLATRLFFRDVCNLIAAAGPEKTLATQVTRKQTTASLEKMAGAFARDRKQADERLVRLLNKLREVPDNALKSVTTHLKKEGVVWANSLRYFANESQDPRQKALFEIMAVMSERQLVGSVFTPDEAVRIAWGAPGAWLGGAAHQSATALRMVATSVLGEALDKPERREQLKEVFGDTSDLFPPAMPVDEAQVTRLADLGLAILREKGSQWAEKLLDNSHADPRFATATNAFAQGQAQEVFEPTEVAQIVWSTPGQGSEPSGDEAVLDRLLVLLAFKLEIRCADNEPAPATPPRPKI